MSYYACPNCHHESDIFGFGGGEQMATAMDVPFLGRLPIYQPISLGSDRGIPIVIAEPDSAASRAFARSPSGSRRRWRRRRTAVPRRTRARFR